MTDDERVKILGKTEVKELYYRLDDVKYNNISKARVLSGIEDLDYNTNGTRANNEQNDPDARPEIATEFSLDGYDRIYIGYPIWW